MVRRLVIVGRAPAVIPLGIFRLQSVVRVADDRLARLMGVMTVLAASEIFIWHAPCFSDIDMVLVAVRVKPAQLGVVAAKKRVVLALSFERS